MRFQRLRVSKINSKASKIDFKPFIWFLRAGLPKWLKIEIWKPNKGVAIWQSFFGC